MPLEGMGLHYTPRWPLMVHFCSTLVMFSISTVYHLFLSHTNKTIYLFVARLDYVGICIQIAGTGTSFYFYAFSCPELRFWRNFYIALIYLVCGTTMMVMLNPRNDKDDRVAFRGIMFSLTSLCSMLPIFHVLLFTDAEFLRHLNFQAWTLGMAAYATGVIIFTTRFPECHRPGTFDICGSSH